MATCPRKNPPKIRKPKGSNRGQKVKFIVTDDIIKEVEALAGRGLTQEQLFHYYGISKGCWYDNRHYHPKLDVAVKRGKAKTTAYVAGKLMEKIKQGNLGAIIFYLKTQARWSEHSTLGIENNDKPPIVPLTIGVTDPVEAAKVYQQIMQGC